MKLSRKTIQSIAEMAEHYLDNMDTHDPSEENELIQLQKLCNEIPVTFAIEIERVEIVPQTTDIILNHVVKKLLIMLEADDDLGSEVYINLENAIWQYLRDTYGFDSEEYHLLKHTTEEALSYAFNHIGIVA